MTAGPSQRFYRARQQGDTLGAAYRAIKAQTVADWISSDRAAYLAFPVRGLVATYRERLSPASRGRQCWTSSRRSPATPLDVASAA